MDLRQIVLLFSVLFGLSSGATDLLPVVKDRDGHIFSFINHSVLKIDQSLKEIGLEPLVCQYTSAGKNKTYAGLTSCLFENLKDTQKHIPSRKIHVWLKTSSQKTLFAELTWDPNDAGWISMLKELFYLYFEKPLNVIRSDRPDLPFRKSLIGELNLTFREPVQVQEVFSSLSSSDWAEKIDVSHIRFQAQPENWKNGSVQYQGHLEVYKSAIEDDRGRLVQLKFHTNFNLLRPDRPFDLKVGTEGVQP